MSEGAIIRGMEGHVYVVGFQSGVVKVGRSGNPKNRLASYFKDGAIHGNPVVETWVSPPHTDSWANETRLIRFCEGRGALASGGNHGEYFTGLTFEEVSSYGETLGFPRFGKEQQEQYAAESERVRKAWSEYFGLDLLLKLPPRVKVDVASLEDWFDGIADDDPLLDSLSDLFGAMVEDLLKLPMPLQREIIQHAIDTLNLRQDVDCLEGWLEKANAAVRQHVTSELDVIRYEIQKAIAEDYWNRRQDGT